MTEPDYKIEELFNTRILKVQFVIYARTIYDSWSAAVDTRYDTLEEAKEVVSMLRKYKDRVFHYVEEE
jgi:predicted nucleotidyltransferase component of viral defense system